MTDFLKKIIVLYQRIWRPNHVVISGIKIYSGPQVPKKIRRQLFKFRHETEELQYLPSLIEKGDCVIECGAGIGATTAMIGKIVGSKSLISLEPNANAHNIIHKTLDLNGVSTRVRSQAISCDEKGLDIYMMVNWLSSSSTQRSDEAVKVHVQTTTLQKLQHELNANVLVIDVEGAEVEVLTEESLQGFAKLLIEFHPHIVGEKSANELKSNLLSWGFENISPLEPN
ncbi:MAG: FkbM family methyltransferase, partial [Alphaproteobacteria bacterium]